jgi:hypothetical protein
MNLLKPTVYKAIDLFENGNLFPNAFFVNYGFKPGTKKQDTLSFSWEPLYDGKYFDFLEEFSKQDQRFLGYKENVEQLGSIGSSYIQAFSLTSRQIDVEKETNRIAFIFHYLILLSEKEYK